MKMQDFGFVLVKKHYKMAKIEKKGVVK